MFHLVTRRSGVSLSAPAAAARPFANSSFLADDGGGPIPGSVSAAFSAAALRVPGAATRVDSSFLAASSGMPLIGSTSSTVAAGNGGGALPGGVAKDESSSAAWRMRGAGTDAGSGAPFSTVQNLSHTDSSKLSPGVHVPVQLMPNIKETPSYSKII